MDTLSDLCHQVEIGGYTVNYVKIGSGPIKICLFPGLLASPRHTCVDLIRRFGKDGDKCTVYAWETPGYFESVPPRRIKGDVSFQVDVNLCLQFLKVLGVSKCVIMGWSAGGQIGIQFAIKYPQVVEKIIVWGTWDVFDTSHYPAHLCHRDLKNVEKEYLKSTLEAHGMSYEEYEKHWHAWMDMIEREHFNQDKEAWVQKFKEITCPTLIIAGSNDPFGPLVQAQHLHQHIVNSRLEIIEKAPHWMQTTHLDEMYKYITNFLFN